jgi:hypothetical protein
LSVMGFNLLGDGIRDVLAPEVGRDYQRYDVERKPRTRPPEQTSPVERS